MNSSTSSFGTPSPNSSGTTTPISQRRSSTSSLASPHYVSSPRSSNGQLNSPMRSSMKSSLKKSSSVGANLNRRSAPPIVRFSEPEPLPRRNTDVARTNSSNTPTSPSFPLGQRTQRLSMGPHQYKTKNVRLVSSTQHPISPTGTVRAQQPTSPRSTSSTQPLRGPPLSHLKSGGQTRPRLEKRFSAPATCSQLDPRLDPRWSGIPLPAGFTPTMLGATQRATSYHSMISNLSVQSSPPATVAPPTTEPPKQYDPLQNYVPCMAAMCTAHYLPAHSGPTYYFSQEPYNLSRHHGYCPRHASKEMKEANALCKREWERMRQNAGRSTLGAVAEDFEMFLQLYRETRAKEDAQLQQRQKRVVLGSPKLSSPSKSNNATNQDGEWNWRYTPRPCTKQGCTQPYYSPYATHLFSFYTSRRPATGVVPQATLCPQCSQAEVEGFERTVDEKWSSRCGWNAVEWEQWHSNAKKDREMEMEFWEKAQERVVREKKVVPKAAAAKVAPKVAPKVAAVQAVQVVQEVKKVEVPEKKRRRSVFRRMFSRATISEA